MNEPSKEEDIKKMQDLDIQLEDMIADRIITPFAHVNDTGEVPVLGTQLEIDFDAEVEEAELPEITIIKEIFKKSKLPDATQEELDFLDGMFQKRIEDERA